MTRERMKELLPVMQAFAEGKVIQFRNPEDKGNWRIAHKEEFNFANTRTEARIKPEPREWLVVVHPSNLVTNEGVRVYTGTGEIIKVREVLDED